MASSSPRIASPSRLTLTAKPASRRSPTWRRNAGSAAGMMTPRVSARMRWRTIAATGRGAAIEASAASRSAARSGAGSDGGSPAPTRSRSCAIDRPRLRRAQHLVGEGEQELASTVVAEQPAEPVGAPALACRRLGAGDARAAARRATPRRRRDRRSARPHPTSSGACYKVAVLCVVGDLVEDVVVRVAAAPERGTDTPARITRSPGGSAANVAAAAALAGCPVAVRRARGCGRHRRAPRRRTGGARRRRARPARGRHRDDRRARRAGGERTMLPDRGAAQELGPIDAAWATACRGSTCRPTRCAPNRSRTNTIEFVRRAGGRGSAWTCRPSRSSARSAPARFAELLEELAPDVVFATVAEAALVGPVGPPLLVVKDGGRPVVLRRADGSEEQVPVAAVARRRRHHGRWRRLRRRVPRRHARRRGPGRRGTRAAPRSPARTVTIAGARRGMIGRHGGFDRPWNWTPPWSSSPVASTGC